MHQKLSRWKEIILFFMLICVMISLTGCEVTIKTRDYSKDRGTKAENTSKINKKQKLTKNPKIQGFKANTNRLKKQSNNKELNLSNSRNSTNSKNMKNTQKASSSNSSENILSKLGLDFLNAKTIKKQSNKQKELTASQIAWTWPVKTTRENPIALKKTSEGMLFIGKPKTPVLASAKGFVMYMGNSLAEYGNLIIIKHSEQLLSVYAKNKRCFVKEGEIVFAGQLIAEMPESGKMLFEIRQSGKALDPLKFLPNKMK